MSDEYKVVKTKKSGTKAHKKADVVRLKKVYTATIYKTDGSTITVTEPKSFFTLGWFHKAVKGLIETYPCDNKRTFVMNEEGLLIPLPRNDFIKKAFPEEMEGMEFYGDVVVVPNAVMN